MDLLTLQETMQKLGLSDSTIRRMMKRGQISAQKIKGRYYFHVSEVNRLLPSPSDTDKIILDLSSRLGSLEQEVEELKQQIEHLTKLVRIGEKPPVVSQLVNTPPPQIKASQPHSDAIPELPDGTLHFHDWLIAHNLKDHRRRILGYLENGRNGLKHEAYPKTNRPNELDRYLKPDQQEALMVWLREHHPEVLEQ